MSFKRITRLLLTLAFSCIELGFPQTAPRWKQLRQDGLTAYGLGHYRQAEIALLASKQEAKGGGAEPQELADLWTELAATYSALARYAEAEALDRQALKVREQTSGPDSRLVALSLNSLGADLVQQARAKDGEPFVRKAVAILESTSPSDDSALVMALNNLGAMYWAERRDSEAKSSYTRALSVSERIDTHPGEAEILSSLAGLCSDEGEYAEADRMARRALDLQERAFGPESGQTAGALRNLADVMSAEGKHADAAPVYRRALTLHEKILGASSFQVALTESMWMFATCGRLSAPGACAAKNDDIQFATIRPAAAPKNEMSVLSTSTCRIICARLAPSAKRMASSRCRPRALVSSKFAMFTQAISSRQPTAPSRTSSAVCTSATR